MKKRFFFAIPILIITLIAVAYSIFDKPQKELSTENYSKHYDISLISNEFRNESYEETFIKYQDKLEEAIKHYEEGGLLEEDKPNPDFFIEKARYAGYLGQTDWAIEILNNSFDYYNNFSVAWNNLAKLYEGKKDYIKANEYYQKIMDAFSEEAYWTLYYNMAKNAILMHNKAKVEEYYQRYRSFGGTIEEVEDYLQTN